MLYWELFIVGVFQTLLQFGACENNKVMDIRFNRDYTMVVLDPYVALEHLDNGDIFTNNDLEPMIEKVSSRFDKIVVQPDLFASLEYVKSSGAGRIPLAVATFNAKRKKSFNGEAPRNPLEVWLACRLSWIKKKRNFSSTLKALYDIAQRANTNFPGTVTVLLLDYMNVAHFTNETIARDMMEVRKIFHKQSNISDAYKIAVGLTISTPATRHSGPELFTQNMSSLFEQADVAVFTMLPNDEYVQQGSKGDQTEHFISKFEEIKSALAKSTSIPVMFKTGWPDTNDAGFTSYFNLVYFWRRISSWANDSQTPVVLNGAFDQLILTRPYYKTMGWWCFVSNGTYTGTSEYIFEEKITLAREDDEKPTDSRNNLTLLRLNNDVQFSGEHVIVQLAPVDLGEKTSIRDFYGSSNIMTLVKLVSGRFEKFFMTNIDGREDMSRYTLLPKSVGMLNKEMLGENSDKKPLELVMMFSGKSFEGGLKSFEITRKYAEEANVLSQGTVKSLILKDTRMGDDVRILRNVSSTGSEFEFGRFIGLTTCFMPTHRREYESFLSLLTFLNLSRPSECKLIFKFTTDIYFIKLGLERALSQLTSTFDSCKRRIQILAANVKVCFYTSWPDTDEFGTVNYAQMVNYWEEMTAWAVRSSTTIILNGAFDIPGNTDTATKTCGWWKLIENDTYRLISDFKFEEKKTLARHLLGQEGSYRPQEQSYSPLLGASGIALIIAVTFVLLGAVTAPLGFYFFMKQRKKKSEVSDVELKEFLMGGSNGLIPYDCKPYDKNHWEIDDDAFRICTECTLGSGEFGVVCKGFVKPIGIDVVTDETAVAVKMSRPGSSVALKGLLSEIKILSYLGKHDNVVALIGAHTESLSQGTVYVFVELCELGSLQAYLRTVHLDDDIKPKNIGLILDEFHRWCREIAGGMKFIAEKKVVHADLATRNILLSSDRTVKISDFGLARKLYNYAQYTKKQKEPLPWRWMAPESLDHMIFNEKSDLWAFGVTLWEIYSLGRTPYPGLSWTSDFTRQLEDGQLRLGKPRLCKSEVFSVMLKCWDSDAARRPTFSDIQEELLVNSGTYVDI